MDRDAAEYHEASTTPDVTAADSALDLLKDQVEEACQGALPTTREELKKQMWLAVRAALRVLAQEGKLFELLQKPEAPSKTDLRAVVGEIIYARDPLLMARCADFAFDLGITGNSETEIAEDFGIVKGTVSAICCNLRDLHKGGQPGFRMKSLEAVAKYKSNMTGKRAKPPRVPWEFEGRFKDLCVK